MNERRESRFEADQPVWVTVYGAVDVRVQGRVRDFSGRGLGLEVAQPIYTGTALKLEIADSMLLGEAIFCRRDGECFYVGIELEQALHHLVDLSEMLRGFTEEPSGPEHAYTVHDAGGQDQQKPH
jgi:hypothetical protein